jgi:hypothetical protein
MTCDEFLSAMKSRGAIITAPVSTQQTQITNTVLQQMRCAMIPAFMADLYKYCNSINLGNGYIFGPAETQRGNRFPIPTIISVNQDMSTLGRTVGKTIFGRNDLFWFAFDAFGVCYMLDNLTLTPLRKYDDPYRAMADCLIAGKM